MAFPKKSEPSFVVTGTVENVYLNDKPKYKSIAIVLNGEKYTKFVDILPSTPPLVKGDEIELMATKNGEYFNWESYKVTSNASPKAVVEKGADAFNSNQYRITYASARNAAIELAAILVDKDLLVLPASKKNQAETVVEYIKHMTDAFTKEAWEASPNDVAEDKASEKGEVETAWKE
jgi:hypothetical protein